MSGFHENASFEGGRRAPSRRLPGRNWSPLGDRLPHSPRPPFSSAVVNLRRSWGAFMKIRFYGWAPRSAAAVARFKLIAARRSAPTSSWAVASLNKLWGTFKKYKKPPPSLTTQFKQSCNIESRRTLRHPKLKLVQVLPMKLKGLIEVLWPVSYVRGVVEAPGFVT